jgi:hypothetical protein
MAGRDFKLSQYGFAKGFSRDARAVGNEENCAIWHGVLLGELNFRPQVFESAGAIVNLLPAYNNATEPNFVTRLAGK